MRCRIKTSSPTSEDMVPTPTLVIICIFMHALIGRSGLPRGREAIELHTDQYNSEDAWRSCSKDARLFCRRMYFFDMYATPRLVITSVAFPSNAAPRYISRGGRQSLTLLHLLDLKHHDSGHEDHIDLVASPQVFPCQAPLNSDNTSSTPRPAQIPDGA